MWRAMVLAALVLVSARWFPQVHAQDGPEWCWYVGDQFSMVITDSSLIVHHDAARYNCCIDGIEEQVALLDGNRIEIREIEHLTDYGGCACLCCYDVSAEIVGLLPGVHSLRFLWQDYDQGWPGWQVRTMEVVIPEDIETCFPWSRALNSACLQAPQPVESETWGRIKVRFFKAR